jgi:hypothetical protein
MVVIGIPVDHAALFMRRRAAEAGAAPNNGVVVERREAPPPTSLGAECLVSVPGGPIARLRPGEVSQTSWRLPALHPLARRRNEKGEGRARVGKNGAGGALVLRAV